MQNNRIMVRTSKGVLRAEVRENNEYPGIWVYMNDELVNIVELYEDEEVLKSHTYDMHNEEPINSIVLIDFNEKDDEEDSL